MYPKSAVTIDNILQAAALLFVDRNYADVSMDDIAESANMTKGALYHHFQSKEKLYVALMLNTLEEINHHQEASFASLKGSCREKMERFLCNFMTLPELSLRLLRLFRRDINIFKNPTRQRLIEAYQATVPLRIEKLIQEGIASGELQHYDARLLSWLHVAMVEVMLSGYGKQMMGEEARATLLITLFFDGLSPKATNELENELEVLTG
ncbi:MAG: TetR/AcrR family transcriptional regulator [Deinococcales bacterium]